MIASKSIELANISYTRKFIDALRLFAEPRTFIITNMAITPMSQNMKNTNKLFALNRPIEAIWKSKIIVPESFVCSRSGFPAMLAASSTIDDIMSRTIDIPERLNDKGMFRYGMYAKFSTGTEPLYKYTIAAYIETKSPASADIAGRSLKLLFINAFMIIRIAQSAIKNNIIGINQNTMNTTIMTVRPVIKAIK